MAFIRRTNTQLLIALALTLVYHGTLLMRTFSGTFDALIHIFFADHYARAWFDNWEPRWYTGFIITSYPPGSHQLIALLSHVIGLRGGFYVVQLCALLMSVLGVYRFSRLWVSDEAAGYAALLAVFSTSLIETVHIYGQLPTIFSLGFLLNSLPYARRWLQRGGRRALLTAWAVSAACTAGHHVTTLFGAVFFIAPVIATILLDAWQRPLPGEPELAGWRKGNWRAMLRVHIRRVRAPVIRSAVFGFGLIAILIVVVLAYWWWSLTDPITQVSIPHPSRDSYLVDLNAAMLFWLIPYGVAALALPYVLWRSLASRAWPLGLGLSLLTLLGTGGTTPIPRLILGEAYYILTMERFTFWSTIIMLPFLGQLVVSLRHGRIALWISLGYGTIGLRVAQVILALTYLAAAIAVSGFTLIRPIEPAPLDMRPIVEFLAKDQHWRYRYLTLGFGDQQAWLATQTTALSVDGDYHSARRLPELTTEPVGTLDSAKYLGAGGLNSLRQILGMPEKYNLNYTFSNDRYYDPLLYYSGWQRVERLENGVVVWERGDVPPLPEVLPRREISPWLRLLWGLAPLTAVGLALLALSANLWIPLLGKIARLLGFDWSGSWRRRTRAGASASGGVAGLVPQSGENGVSPVASAKPPRPASPARRFRLPRVPAPTARQMTLVALALLVVCSAVGGDIWQRREARAREPLAIVAEYYHYLDYREFDHAWAMLDPQTRPTFEQYRLDRSLEGGLVASYGKLEGVVPRIVTTESDRLEVQANLSWLTALGPYPTTERLTLVRRGAGWFVLPETTPEILPADEFFRRPTVDWRSQGRRRATIGTTDYEDILDRPDIQIVSAKLVQVNGRYSIVGEVLNRDVDPAEVNVTAILYDSTGAILARYNAQIAAAHRLFPKEVAPFRVDFDSVAAAGLTAGDGTGPGQIAGFSVQASALILGAELGRDVSVQGLSTVQGADGALHLVGQVLNTGTLEATIPHLVVTYYDEAGQVAWVDSLTLPASIRPERSEAFDLPVLPASARRAIAAQGAVATNGIAAPLPEVDGSIGRLLLPAGSGYSSASVTVDYYVGTRP